MSQPPSDPQGYWQQGYSQQQAGYPGYPGYYSLTPQSHSGPGIASFIIGLAGALLTFGMIVVAGIMEVQTPGGMNEESPQAMMAGCGLLSGAGLCLVSIVLGLVGVVQRDRKKLFAILGLCCSAGMLLLTAGLMAIGFAAQQ